MRYSNVPIITFTDIDGNVFQVRDKRDIPDYNLLTMYNKNSQEDIDEIITKPEFYGEGQEALSFLIIDFTL